MLPTDISPNTNKTQIFSVKARIRGMIHQESRALANASSGVSHAGLSRAQSIQCLGKHGLCTRLGLHRQGNFQHLLFM